MVNTLHLKKKASALETFLVTEKMICSENLKKKSFLFLLTIIKTNLSGKNTRGDDPTFCGCALHIF